MTTDNAARIQELEQELTGVNEVLARIEKAIAGIDPEDFDRLSDEGGRRAIMVRHKQEIEAELATLRNAAGGMPAATPPSIPCRRLASAVIYSIAPTPDGTAILCGGDDGLHLRDAVTGGTQRSYAFGGGRLSVAVSPDGRFAAARSFDEGVAVFNIATGQKGQTIPTARSPANIAFTPDGTHLLAVLDGARRRIAVSRFPGTVERSIGLGFNEEITFFTVSSDGRAVLAVGGPRCLLFGWRDGVPDASPNVGGGPITAAALGVAPLPTVLGHLHGTLAIGRVREPSPDFFIWQPTRIYRNLTTERIQDVALTADGRLLALRTPTVVRVFRLAADHQISPVAVFTDVGDVDMTARRSLVFTGDGRSFYTAGYQGLFRGDLEGLA